MRWQDILKYAGTGGSISVILLMGLILNLTGMSYTYEGDKFCSTDCYSEIKINSSYWEIRVEHAGDKDLIFKKSSRGRTLWLNLDKIDEAVITEPNIKTQILVGAIKRTATEKHDDYGYLRRLKDGDTLIHRTTKSNPSPSRIILKGSKPSELDVKWSFILNDPLIEKIDIDPVWMGINKENVFPKLISNKAGLTSGESIFEFNNPYKINLTKYFGFYWNRAEGNNLDSLEYFVNYSEEKQVPIYETTYEMANVSNENNETVLQNRSVISLSGYSTEYSEGWRKVEILKPGFYKIKVVGKWKPHLGKQSVDWVPEVTYPKELLGVEKDLFLSKIEWAWWNVTFEVRYPHNDNDSGFEGIGYFGSNQTGWYGTINNSGNTGQIYSYNDTDTLELAVSNETNELCWFDTVNDLSNCPLRTGSDEGLVSYWALDRSTGVVKDYIGNNGGTNNGATRGVAGQVYNAFDFESSEDDNVVISDHESLNITNEITIAFWFKYETETSDFFPARFVSKVNSYEITGPTIISEITFQLPGVFNLPWDVSPLSLETWYFVAGTYNGSVIKLFINDVSVSSFQSGLINQSAADLWLGAYSLSPTGGYELDGELDNVIISNRSYSETEILNLYNSTKDNFPYFGESESVPEDTQCTNTIDTDWLITDAQTCDNQELNIGTGQIVISTGNLTLSNSGNVTASGLNITETGEKIFIFDKSNLII